MMPQPTAASTPSSPSPDHHQHQHHHNHYHHCHSHCCHQDIIITNIIIMTTALIRITAILTIITADRHLCHRHSCQQQQQQQPTVNTIVVDTQTITETVWTHGHFEHHSTRLSSETRPSQSLCLHQNKDSYAFVFKQLLSPHRKGHGESI